jgi:hypothetical protein
MGRDLRGRYIALLYAFVILVGVAVIFGGAQVPKQEWSNGLIALGVTISATSAITWLCRSLGPEEGPSAGELGVPGVKIHRQAERSFYEALRGARTIDLLYNTGQTLIVDHASDIQAALRYSCRVRIVVSFPENASVADKHGEYWLGGNVDLRSASLSVAKTLREIVERLREDQGATGKLEGRYNLAAPTCSMVFINDEVVRVTPYLPYAVDSWRCPCLDVLVRDNWELFRFYKSFFDEVWDNSERVFIKADFRQPRHNDVLPPR